MVSLVRSEWGSFQPFVPSTAYLPTSISYFPPSTLPAPPTL